MYKSNINSKDDQLIQNFQSMKTSDLQKLEKMITNSETIVSNENDFEVTSNFPPKLPLKYQHMFDCRIQLLLKESQNILPGESKLLETTCIITPHHGWILSTKPNPALNLIFCEKYLRNEFEPFRVSVQVTNIQEKSVNLPKGLCVGFLLLY